MGKKKKRTEAEAEAEALEPEIKADDIVNGDSHKKTKKKKHKNDKAALIPTVTVAIAGSIIHNAQSLELATRVLLSLTIQTDLASILLISLPLHFSNHFSFFSFNLSWPVR